MAARPPCAVCGQAVTTVKCSRCGLIYYCSEEHRIQDWGRHKLHCRACEVFLSPELGYCLVATTDIRQGEVIFSENPFILGPAYFSESPCCVGCFRGLPSRMDALPRCLRCQWAICNTYCLGLTHTAGHAVECALLNWVADKSCPQQWLLPIRCLLLQKHKPDVWNWLLNLSATAVAKQADSSKHLNVTSVLEGNAITIFQQNPSFLPLDFSAGTFQKIFAVIDAYGLYFLSALRKTGLTGLYRTAGFLQLSCVANTSTTFFDFPEAVPNMEYGQVVVTALKDIRQGEILSCSYAMSLTSTYIRQVQFSRRNLVCRCPRCLDPREMGLDMGTMKCSYCPGLLLPVDTSRIFTCNWACDRQCGVVELTNEISARYNYFSQMCQDLANPGVIATMQPETLEAMLVNFLTKLHPNHELCLSLRRLLLQSYCSSNLNAAQQSTINDRLDGRAVFAREMMYAIDNMGPNIHGAEMIVASTLRMCVEVFFLHTQRKFPLAIWKPEQVVHNVGLCLLLLERAFKILQTTEPDLNMFTSIRGVYNSILLWARTNGLNIPVPVNINLAML